MHVAVAWRMRDARLKIEFELDFGNELLFVAVACWVVRVIGLLDPFICDRDVLLVADGSTSCSSSNPGSGLGSYRTSRNRVVYTAQKAMNWACDEGMPYPLPWSSVGRASRKVRLRT